METIGELLSRDLTQRIEEVIQVHQADEQSVYSEVSEYVATNSIRDQYAMLLKAIAEAPAEPHESIGVWISGFFGSGKSSYAKNLGYALKNPSVMGEDFARLFKRQLDDEGIANLLDLINAKIPTEVTLRGCQGEGHPKGHGADRRVDVRRSPPGAWLRRGMGHR